MKTAQAALELAKLNLAWTKVYAPCDGQVSRQLIDPGNMVQADHDPADHHRHAGPDLRLLRHRRADAAGTAAAWFWSGRGSWGRRARPSIKVLLGLADEEGYPHEGTIDFAENRLDMMTGTLRVRGVFPNPKRILSPGMFARIRVPIGEPHRAILIPEEALGSDQGQRFLYVVGDENKVEYRRVQIGSLQGKLRVIEKGLAEGDRIVLAPCNGLDPQTKEVRPKTKRGRAASKVVPLFRGARRHSGA